MTSAVSDQNTPADPLGDLIRTAFDRFEITSVSHSDIVMVIDRSTADPDVNWPGHVFAEFTGKNAHQEARQAFWGFVAQDVRRGRKRRSSVKPSRAAPTTIWLVRVRYVRDSPPKMASRAAVQVVPQSMARQATPQSVEPLWRMNGKVMTCRHLGVSLLQ